MSEEVPLQRAEQFTGMPRLEVGEVITRPQLIERDYVDLNVEAINGPEVRLALRHPDGSFIPGYGHEDSETGLAYRFAAQARALEEQGGSFYPERAESMAAFPREGGCTAQIPLQGLITIPPPTLGSSCRPLPGRGR